MAASARSATTMNIFREPGVRSSTSCSYLRFLLIFFGVIFVCNVLLMSFVWRAELLSSADDGVAPATKPAATHVRRPPDGDFLNGDAADDGAIDDPIADDGGPGGGSGVRVAATSAAGADVEFPLKGRRFPFGRLFCMLPIDADVVHAVDEPYRPEFAAAAGIDLGSPIEVLFVHVGPDLNYGRHVLESVRQLRAMNPTLPATFLLSQSAFQSDPAIAHSLRCFGIRVIFNDPLAKDELVARASGSFYIGGINMGNVNTPSDFNLRTSIRMFYVHAYMARAHTKRRVFHLENDNIPFDSLTALDAALQQKGYDKPAAPPRTVESCILGFSYLPNVESLKDMLLWWVKVFEAGPGRTREFLDTNDLNDMTLSAGYHVRNPGGFRLLNSPGSPFVDTNPVYEIYPKIIDNLGVFIWHFGDFHNRRPFVNPDGWGSYLNMDPKRFDLYWDREPLQQPCSRPVYREIAGPDHTEFEIFSFHVHMKNVLQVSSGCRAFQRVPANAVLKEVAGLANDYHQIISLFGPNMAKLAIPLLTRAALTSDNPVAAGSVQHVLTDFFESRDEMARTVSELLLGYASSFGSIVLFGTRWQYPLEADLKANPALRALFEEPSNFAVFSTTCRYPGLGTAPNLRCLPVGISDAAASLAKSGVPLILDAMQIAVDGDGGGGAAVRPVDSIVVQPGLAAPVHLPRATALPAADGAVGWLRALGSHRFALCGPNAERDELATNVECAWEAMMLGALPIVVVPEGHDDPVYADLPVTFVSSPNEVTQDLLDAIAHRLLDPAAGFVMDRVLYLHWAGLFQAYRIPEVFKDGRKHPPYSSLTHHKYSFRSSSGSSALAT